MRSRFAILLAVAVVCVTTALASWTPEAMVTGDSTQRDLNQRQGRKLVFDTDGVGHLIWHGSSGIWCNRYNPGSGWSADYQVSPTGSLPAIALDADGTTIHAIWSETRSYTRCVQNQYGEDVWGEIVPLPGAGSYPVIASVPNEANHVVVCASEEIYSGRKYVGEAINFVECIGGVWSTPIRLDSSGTNWRRAPSVAVGPNGDVFIAYFNNARHVMVKTRHNGTWGTTVDVTPGFPTIDWAAAAAIEVNPVTGNPHVGFYWYWITQVSKKVKVTTWAIYHTYRNSSGTWLTTPEQISVTRQGSPKYDSPGPTMTFLGSGGLYAVWNITLPVTSRGVAYNYCPVEGGAWNGQAWVSADTSPNYSVVLPHVTNSGASQTVHVVWGRIYDSIFPLIPREIWWSTNYVGGGSGGMGQPVAMSKSSIELFPNPARSGRVTVKYAVPHAGPVTVTLLDVSGRAIRRSALGVRSSAEGSFALDASGLRAGVYVLKLDVGTTSQTRKVVIE
jgi:hypothetical protein